MISEPAPKLFHGVSPSSVRTNLPLCVSQIGAGRDIVSGYHPRFPFACRRTTFASS
jgi:hypothetical protein